MKTHRVSTVMRNIGWRGLVRLEQWLAWGRRPPSNQSSSDITSLFNDRWVICPLVSDSGLVYRFSESDIEKVRASGCDLLIRAGSGIIRGGMLHATPLGIISFHHADNRVNRGGPPAFWEIVEQRVETGFIIQRLTEELDGGEVLARGAIPTRHSHILNHEAILRRSNVAMRRLLEAVARRMALPDPEPPYPYCGRLYQVPAISVQAQYLIQRAIRSVRAGLDRLIGVRDQWGVCFAFNDWGSLVMRKATKLRPLPGTFLADPFVIRNNDLSYCFVEEFIYEKGMARIAVYDIRKEVAQRLGVALEEPFHLSFPYVFEVDGRVFMVPECGSTFEIRLYECVGFPLRWQLRKVLITEISAADPMIIQRDGRWWLFANVDPEGGSDHSSELHLFSTDDLLHGSWVAHAANPVVTGPLNARNAGFVSRGNEVYRVAQRPAFLRYGSGLSVRRIELLTQTRYSECEEALVDARFAAGVIGTHHLHSDGEVTVFDYLIRR